MNFEINVGICVCTYQVIFFFCLMLISLSLSLSLYVCPVLLFCIYVGELKLIRWMCVTWCTNLVHILWLSWAEAIFKYRHCLSL